MTAPVASFAEDCLTVSAGGFALDLTVRGIARHWEALSQIPERRARMELGGLGERLNAFAAHVAALISRGGALEATAEVEQFARRHTELTRRAWAMDSRCMSWFVVGPARFPVERNKKRMASADKAFGLVREHVAAARKAVERRAFPHGAPDEPIRASNPDAPDLLRAAIDVRKQSHAAMKAANAAIRSVKGDDVEAMVQAVVDATGWRGSTAREVVCPREAWMGRGFPSYALSLELAEISRLEKRLASIEQQRERGMVERDHNTAAGAVRVVENPDAARIQLVFPGKPDEATRGLLKSNGFRWSPREGAWQRHLNSNGRWAAERVISALQPTAPTAVETRGREVTVTASFETEAEANAYLADHPGEGVLADDGGRILIATLTDLGR